MRKRIIELFNKFYSNNYNLIDIIEKNSIRNSIFIYQCKICNQIIKKEGKYLYRSKPTPKHNCYLNPEYNYQKTKKDLKNRIQFLKENQNKNFKIINFTKEWFLENFESRKKTKIILQCTIHPNYIINTTINNFLNDSGYFGCRICMAENNQEKYKLDTYELKNRLKKLKSWYKFPDIEWFKKNYINSYTKFPVYCTKHYYLNKNFNILKLRNNSSPCPFCSGHKLNYEDFLRKAREIHFNSYEYLISKYNWYNNYINKNNFKIKIKCKKCNSIFEQKIINHLDGYGCPFCSSSKGERKTQKFLEENNINFEYQKIIKRNKKIIFIFDFFIPEKKIVIEYDGEPHYKSIKFYGGEKGLIKRQKKDSQKNKYCKENNINLIRIPYWEFDNIEDILNKKLLK